MMNVFRFIDQWRCGVVGMIALLSALPAAADTAVPSSPDATPFAQEIPNSNVSFKMIQIPGGSFKMGSPDSEKDRGDDEGPQFTVEVEPFYMGATEVTWGEYNLFLQNYSRISQTRKHEVPKDKLADAVTYPTPLYELEAG